MDSIFVILFVLNCLPIGILIVYTIYFLSQKNQTQTKTQYEEPVSILISVYNDEKYLKKRIEYFLNSENWIEGSEILICDDGSTDSTVHILNELDSNPNITIHKNPVNMGKIKSLNNLVKLTKNKLLVFSDIRQSLKPKSIQSMVSHFSDPEIGIVTCKVLDLNADNKISFQRKIGNRIAAINSKKGYTLSLFGALYIQRKKHFQEIPENILFDDFFVLCKALSLNYQIIQDNYAAFFDVNFHKYYYKERIERLTRGMLLQLSNQYDTISQIPFNIRWELIIYKYFKFLIPFNLIVICIIYIYFSFSKQWLYPNIMVTLFLLICLIIPSLRQHVVSGIRFCYYTALAVLKYFIGNNRSNRWQKLKVND